VLIDRKSLLSRLIIPVFLSVFLILAVLVFSIYRITDKLIEEFTDHALAGHVGETMRIIEQAQSDLTTARLLDNPPVVEAKQKLVVEAASLQWERNGILGGITANGGTLIYSALPAGVTAERIFSQLNGSGRFSLKYHGRELRGKVLTYPAWGWRIIIAKSGVTHGDVRREVFYLIPLAVFGSALIVVTLFIFLRRNLQSPVAVMVDDVKQGRPVRPVGVSEFDLLGNTINNALEGIAARSRELSQELQERSRAEASVREKEARIRLILTSAAEGMYGVDTGGVCTFCNPSCLRMLGYEKEEDLLGSIIHGRIHHTRADGTPYPENECNILDAYRTGRNVHIDNEVFWRADGTGFPVEYWSYPIYRDGSCAGAIVTFFDISKRKEDETRLKEEKNKFESIIAAMADGVSIQDRDFDVLYQNNVHKAMFGDLAGGKCFRGFEGREEVCAGCPITGTFSDGQVHHARQTVEHPDGRRYYDITTSPLRDASGEVIACVELVRDVTERRRADENLYHSQRMESIGLLAGGVAHDFNNILSAIFGYAEMLQMEADESMKPYINHILSAAERASALTRSLLAFSSKQEVSLNPLNLNDTVAGFHRMLSRLVGEDIEFRLNLSRPLLMIEADKGQIEQILMNLTTNARDAMPGGGTLMLRTDLLALDQDWGDILKGTYAVISVSDTGSGMDGDTQKHIFEPFYTTKQVGRGTGLGLAIVYGIVKKHNGYIHVYSEPGKGTTFRIYVPLLCSWKADTANERPKPAPSGTETVLLVEDEKSVREVAAAMLSRFGYSVLEAIDGEDAVKLFLENSDKVDLVLCDLIMPRKDGKEAYDEIVKLRPGIKWIFMSGYTADIISQKAIIEEGARFISKPLVPAELLSAVRDALDSDGPAASQLTGS